MKKQSPVFSSTLHCIFAGFCSGFLFNIFIILIVMLVSENLRAENSGDVFDQDRTIHRTEDVKQGSLLFKNTQGFVQAATLHTDVHIQITGMIARATVKQKFHNDSADWQEGIYVFPLPENAAVDQLRMYIGERIIEGQIRVKQQARKEYQQAKSAGKRTSLVEQERPNIFTTSVANIAPDEDIIVEITYQQTVGYADARFSLRFPMVVAPRYIPGNTIVTGFQGSGWSANTDQVNDASRITPSVIKSSQVSEDVSGHIKISNPISLKIDLDTGFLLNLIDSPYHEIDVSMPLQTRYSVQLLDQHIPANRDFELIWRADPDSTPKAALFTEEKDSAAYALIMLVPPAGERAPVLPREVVFVIDTSGSMSGPSIAQAKQALKFALTHLHAGDRFNVIQFNSYTDKLFPFPQVATQHALRQAHRYIDNLVAQGGTEMAPALHAALSRTSKDKHESRREVRQVIFLTDGSIGNEDELFNIIESELNNARLFTIGIGSAPNSHFMSRAATFGRGTHTYIGNISEVQTKMQTLFSKLESPVLTNIHIQWPEACLPECLVETWPQNLPDLYLGEPLLISSRAEILPEHLMVTGDIAGEQWHASLNLKGGQSNSGIPAVWARKKITALMNQMRQKNNHNTNTANAKQNNTSAEDLRKMIIQTALSHHLVSKFTSLIAVDVTPERPEAASLQSAALPVNLPAGWNYDKVFGKMPATASDARLNCLSGLLMLFAGLLLWFIHGLVARKQVPVSTMLQ